MKKIISLLLSLTVLLSLFGCTFVEPEEKTEEFSGIEIQRKYLS